jgi:hypothetical protein
MARTKGANDDHGWRAQRRRPISRLPQLPTLRRVLKRRHLESQRLALRPIIHRCNDCDFPDGMLWKFVFKVEPPERWLRAVLVGWICYRLRQE